MAKRRPPKTLTTRPRSLAADIAAAKALYAAGGRCERCEQSGHALIAVEVGGRFEAHCLDQMGCKRRLRVTPGERGASCR